MRLRLALRVVACNLAVLLAAALVAEAVFGTWFFGPDFGFLNVPRDVVLRHDLSRRRQGGGIAVYRRDHYGFRGAYRTPAEIDVLAIGGSTTNELYLDDDETWVAVLRAEFAAAGRPLVIVNAGVDGQSTVGHIRSFDAWFAKVPGLRPRYVIAYVGLNDVYVESQRRYDAVEESGRWRRLVRRVKNNSALYNLYRTLHGAWRARRVRVVYDAAPRRLRVVSPRVSVAPASYAGRLRAYGRRLRTLAGRIRGLGARPVFVTQMRGDSFPVAGGMLVTGPGAVDRRFVQRLFNRKTMEVCRAVDGICIDLAAELRLAPEDFADNVHTLRSGSRKIGRYLYARLAEVLRE